MKDYSKYLCIFGGGAVRGYSYLGVLRAFEEEGFCPEKVAGSSVGAVIAAFYALDIPIKEMEKIFIEVNFELFRDINFNFAPAFSISKGSVFLDWLRENIEKFYYKEKYQKGKNKPVCFKDIERDLIIVSTDLTNAVPFIFSKEKTPNYEIAMAIRASASLPGLLSPVKYEEKLLTDGDLMKSNPLWRLDKELCPEDLRILELRLEGIKKENTIKNFFDYLNTIYSCVTNYSTDYIIDMYGKKDKFDYIKIDTKDLLLVNFNIKDETKEKLAFLGYNEAIKFFREKLPEKRKNLLNQYKILLEKTIEMEENIKKEEIRKAKIKIGEIFTILADIKRTIDSKYHKKMKKFRNLFFDNIKKTFLFKEKLKEKNKVEEEIKKIKRSLEEKCKELEKNSTGQNRTVDLTGMSRAL